MRSRTSAFGNRERSSCTKWASREGRPSQGSARSPRSPTAARRGTRRSARRRERRVKTVTVLAEQRRILRRPGRGCCATARHAGEPLHQLRVVGRDDLPLGALQPGVARGRKRLACDSFRPGSDRRGASRSRRGGRTRSSGAGPGSRSSWAPPGRSRRRGRRCGRRRHSSAPELLGREVRSDTAASLGEQIDGTAATGTTARWTRNHVGHRRLLRRSQAFGLSEERLSKVMNVRLKA